MAERETFPIYGQKWSEPLQSILDIFPEALCHLNAEGKAVLLNSSFSEVLGKPGSEILGRKIEELGFSKEVTEAFLKMRDSAQEHRSPAFGEFFLKVPGDAVHLFEAVIVPRLDKEGSPQSYLMMIRDITELRRVKIPILEEEALAPSWRVPLDALFICDTEGRLLYGNSAFEKTSNLSIPELLYKSFLSLVHPEDQAKASALFKEALEGKTVNEELRLTSPGQENTWLNVTLAPLGCASSGLMGVQGKIVNITEKKKVLEQLEKSLGILKRSMRETVQAMAAIVEARDPYTAGHQGRVSRLATAIAEELGFPEERKEQVRLAGLVHDLGKISIPSEILTKPARLNEMEMALVRLHPEVAYRILKEIELLNPIGEMVLQHHERLDGSGYPKGLKGDKLSLEGKILAVADVVEAMSSYRPYRPALGVSKALEEINENKGRLYDPAVVEACTRIFQERGFRLD
jgi:PAS domain S-box-containing protein